MWVQGYYPVYRIASLPIANIPWNRLTHLAYFQISPTSTGGIVNDANLTNIVASMATLVNAGHANGKKVTITLGGAGSAPDTTWRSAINSTNRATFVSTLANFISTHNLDGIDLDWEPFETPSDATDYELFVIALRVALPSPKVITMFVQTNQTWKQTFCNAVEPYIDRFGLSTYDLSYGSTTVIHDSPLYSGGGQPAGASANDAANAFIAAGLAPAKLNIAMPQYTAQWTGSAGIFTTGTFNPGNAETYSSLAGVTPTTPPTGEIYDSTLKAAYTFSGGIFKSYNNLATVQAKVDYVNANGLGGIIIWELGQGYFSGGSPANPLLEPFAGQLTDNPAGTSLNHRNASGNYNERIVTNIDAATVTLDMSLGGQHLVTIAGNRTIAVTNVSVGKIFTLRVKQDATGSRTLTWFSGITWAGGTPPTLTTTANKADRLGFVCTGVGTYDGCVIMSNL